MHTKDQENNFDFMTKLDPVDQKVQQKLDGELDFAWYEADEENNKFLDTAGGRSGNDLFDSYTTEEVKKQELAQLEKKKQN